MAAALLNSVNWNRQTSSQPNSQPSTQQADRAQRRQAHTVVYSDTDAAAGTQGVRAAASAQEMQAAADTAAIYPDTVAQGFCYLDMLIVTEVAVEAKQMQPATSRMRRTNAPM